MESAVEAGIGEQCRTNIIVIGTFLAVSEAGRFVNESICVFVTQ